MAAFTASARKSQGQYKPLIVAPDGTTKVVEQASRFTSTVYGVRRSGDYYSAGNTYATREEATAAAQAYIERCLADAQDRLAKAQAAGCPAERCRPLLAEIALWGGQA